MAIELTNICKSYPPKQVIKDVNLTFPIGITCIMGPSGIGKTTLIYIIAGLVKPDSGYISGLDGKKISMVFQEDRLLEWESAISNILFVTKSASKNQEKAKQLLTQSGLADSVYKKVSELSGGMKRRVCLCRALIADYDLLILDEPFKGLDANIKPSIMTMVKEHTLNSHNKTVICITHDPEEAAFLGGGVVTL